jgi:hypothetical protein
MLELTKRGADFSRGCALSVIHCRFLRTHPITLSFACGKHLDVPSDSTRWSGSCAGAYPTDPSTSLGVLECHFRTPPSPAHQEYSNSGR